RFFAAYAPVFFATSRRVRLDDYDPPEREPMTKNQARVFALVCSFGFFAIFIGLTIHTQLRIGEQTHDENITPAVVAGNHVWHKKNCINCHTILGEGAYYAPDLTKITKQRGEAYL